MTVEELQLRIEELLKAERITKSSEVNICYEGVFDEARGTAASVFEKKKTLLIGDVREKTIKSFRERESMERNINTVKTLNEYLHLLASGEEICEQTPVFAASEESGEEVYELGIRLAPNGNLVFYPILTP